MVERFNRTLDGRVNFHIYGGTSSAETLSLQQKLSKDPKSDHGLRFTKFFGRWVDGAFDPPDLLKNVRVVRDVLHHENWEEQPPKAESTQPVLDWLDPSTQIGNRKKGAHVRLIIGDANRLKESCDRLRALAEETFELHLVSRLLTGLGLEHPTENGFLFHPTLAVPYVRGTALKQVARDWAELEGVDPARVATVFGAVDKTGKPVSSGRVAFLDALPATPVILTAEQITNHYTDYYGGSNPALGLKVDNPPADWYEPIPVTLLAVEASFNAPLTFRFGLRGPEPFRAEAAEWLRQGLEIYGVGARTTDGYGRFRSKAAAPLVKGDRARVSQIFSDAKWRGAIGEIIDDQTVPGRMKIKRDADFNGRRPEIYVPSDQLERLDGSDG